jgi:hypothetical protein
MAYGFAKRPSGRVDLLLSDIVLGKGTNGANLAGQVRASLLHTKILLMSGYAREVFSCNATLCSRGSPTDPFDIRRHGSVGMEIRLEQPVPVNQSKVSPGSNTFKYEHQGAPYRRRS